MFKNVLLYRIDQWEQPSLPEIEDRLNSVRFSPCSATQPESIGWVEARGERNAALLESVGGQLVLRLCTERKAVPGSAVKNTLEERLAKIELETGRRPKGKAAKEIKEEIVQDLLPRAFPKRSSTLIWIDAKARLVVVDTASLKKADNVLTLLSEALGGGLRLTLLQTATSPGVAMSEWLKTKEAPAGFTIDRDCELKQPDSEKACVRYARHTLDIDEVGEHITQGKVPTQLAMTWDSRVSFMLTETMTLKKLKLLDVVLEGPSSSANNKDSGFETDIALVTGELSRLIPDLLDALGGELDPSQPLQDVAAVKAAEPVPA
jgi:recombination associated protein RdgC